MFRALQSYRSGDKTVVSQIRQLQALLKTLPMKKKNLHSIAYRYAPLLYSFFRS
jgi:hypothetical protein